MSRLSDTTTSKLSSSLFKQWEEEVALRKRLLPEIEADPSQSLRLIDKKDDGYCIDRYGDHLWVYRYLSKEPLEEKSSIEQLQELTGTRTAICRQMLNRGKSPHLDSHEENKNWIAKEGPLKFHLSSESGWSPGLFLDQRKNRHWVRTQSKDKSVLNLFCYTAGFSLNAAYGGAKEVVSVDTSSASLEWAKRNFALNQLEPDQFEFFAADARDFLKGCQRRERKFDLIVCDPPSFARNKKGLFRLEKELDSLLSSLLSSLEEEGQLLFSCNLEKWTAPALQRQLKKISGCKVVPAPGKDLDFTSPNSMKSYIIKRN